MNKVKQQRYGKTVRSDGKRFKEGNSTCNPLRGNVEDGLVNIVNPYDSFPLCNSNDAV